MKHKLLLTAFFISNLIYFSSCEKNHTGSNSGGGLLPTNYIVIHDSSFSPSTLSVVSGSSITFLNQTNSVQRLISDDSTTIRDTSIAPHKSFFYKKDDVGVFYYHLVNKITARGTFIVTP
jgi:hypothetical protein